MKKILVIDDDKDMCLLLNRFLTRKGFEVTEIYNGKKALAYLETSQPDLVMCDFRLEDMDGTTLLVKIKEKFPSMPIIIMTGYSDMRTAVQVMKMGALDYVTKPLLPDEILITIQQALDHTAEKTSGETSTTTTTTAASTEKKEKQTGATYSGQYIFGTTDAMRKIIKQVDLVAPTNYSVIIYGESGSGKEAIAQEIHKRSKRKDKPFVAIDCGALSKELAGSELFGHEKGAFTGALNQKIGSFEHANGGTIFLDEISNLSYDIQVSLLRVVQERKVRRVGGVKDIDLDVRIIIASNELLWNATRAGKFREDLYHRFNEFTINIPPLRERKDDLMLFANHFLKLTNEELAKNVTGFSPEVENIFKSYVWYGNLRELKNVIKRATLLTDTDLIEPTSLPFEIAHYSKLQFSENAEGSPAPMISSYNEPAAVINKPQISETSLKEASIDAEYEMILQALKQANYNKSKAAKILKIDRKTLYNKMSQYQELKNQ
ncbi:MAG: sigma-54-dependent Fis family transcriptional regulator [Gemmatimonadaceae bacterium]|nr:sigma-54-dependent Fis family transcriptional regulator [Chitinophagaceae bacterium]